jgi:hypothetical protein
MCAIVVKIAATAAKTCVTALKIGAIGVSR